MRKTNATETKENLGRAERILLVRNGLVTMLLNEKIWQKIVDHYNNKYKNNPGILCQIDLISRDDHVRNSGRFYRGRRN